MTQNKDRKVRKKLIYLLLPLLIAIILCVPPVMSGGTYYLPSILSHEQKKGIDFPEHGLGLVLPDNWWVDEPFDPCTPPPTLGLPDAFDWRDFNGVPPIRNQASCGSCWAFSAVAPLECNILIRDGDLVDLSEQWLVSECTGAGDCDGGWPAEAFKYFLEDGLTDPCGDSGAVLEEDFPYQAENSPCDCPYPHPYFIDGYALIGGGGGDIPPPDAIKQAILDYGPVSVGVATNNAFHNYDGGIYDGCEGGQLNHAVALVGWDDNQGPNGVWILRNSWGTGWGEDGYMRIPYGCAKVGSSAAYVKYEEPDCNGNGIPDDEDINNGFSLDCNGNGRPDECDIAYGISEDINDNGIPDECESCQLEHIIASNGENGNNFGCALALDGNVAVIGASGDNENGVYAGAAYIYRYDGTNWVEEQHLLPAEGHEKDYFGTDVDISGNRVIIGASGNDDSGELAGAAYIYEFTGTTWVEQQKLVASDGQEGDRFGATVALDGDTAVVGAPHDDTAQGEDAGSAYVFSFTVATWDEEEHLIASDAEENDMFGTSVGIDDTHICIGAFWSGDNGDRTGAAYMYHYEDNAWVEEQQLKPLDSTPHDWFGFAVDISDDVAIISSYLDDDNGYDSGSAYIFRYEDGLWVEEAKLLPSDGGSYGYFGNDVALDGIIALVGMEKDDDNGHDSGSAYAFRYDGSTWVQLPKYVDLDGTNYDNFGGAVAVDDGIALVGSPLDNDNGIDGGSVFVFGGLLELDCNSNGIIDAFDIRDGTSADVNANFIPDDCEIIGDINSDGIVNTDDLLMVLSAWGNLGGTEDINNDGVVNVEDLLLLLGQWT